MIVKFSICSGDSCVKGGHSFYTPALRNNAGAAVNLAKFFFDTLPHMSIRAGVIIAVAFQQIDDAPYAEASTQRDHQNLQSVNRGCEKCHSVPP